VVAVAPGSPAAQAGVVVGDQLLTVNGEVPRDIIRYHLLVDEAEVGLEVDRGGLQLEVDISKRAGEPLGLEVSASVFDQVRTCDNHCEFCFIYQLPKGMRPSLYLKDDDYRLSFLYGNFTTLTRFTEADLERVVTEKLSPLYVSIHATNAEIRADLLRNRRGAVSLRWLRQLLDHGIEVHGQVVVCPGLNGSSVLHETLLGILDAYPELTTVAVVPLGISDHSGEERMRSHTVAEANEIIDLVDHMQHLFTEVLGRRTVYAADEYYLLADRPFPSAEAYGEVPMHEDGVGMASTFAEEFLGEATVGVGPKAGFFASGDGAPAEGYRAPRLGAPDPAAAPHAAAEATPAVATPVTLRPRPNAAVGVITGAYGARVLQPLLDQVAGDLPSPTRLVVVPNQFFGGNISVTGLLVGSDVSAALADQPEGHRYLLPDVCLSNGLFLDGATVADLPRPVEVIGTDGVSLRRALGTTRSAP
jgi:putative radical SAM enzyme (TIGR03279 family)